MKRVDLLTYLTNMNRILDSTILKNRLNLYFSFNLINYEKY